MRIYLYSLPDGASRVDVFYNDESGEIENDINPNGKGRYPQYNDAQELTSFCSGTTRVRILTQSQAPYAYPLYIENSSDCGYVPNPGPVSSGDSLFIASLNSTDQTKYGINDGSVIITVGGNIGLYYTSIDNVNFDRQKLKFEGLPPGVYTFYLADANGANTSQQNFTIAQDIAIYGCRNPSALNYDVNADLDNGTCVFYTPDPGLPPDPPVLPVSMPDDNRLNLYQDPDIFRIGINGLWTEVDMPIGWDKVEFSIERDETYHGLNYEYNDGAIELGFDAAAGGDLLREQYQENGNDAQVQFQFGRDLYGLFIPDVDGWIDFNTYRIDRDKVTASVKRKTFNDDLETKSEVIVSLKDGYLPLPLHSKLIRKQSIVNTGYQTGADTIVLAEKVGTNLPGGFGFRQMVYGFIDFTKATAGDLSTSAPGFGVQSGNPGLNKQYIFKTDGGGPFNFDIEMVVRMGTHMNQPSVAFETPRQRNWNYDWFISVVSGGVENYYVFDGSLSGYTDSRNNDITQKFKINKSLTLLQDDEVYIFGRYSFEASGSYNSVNAQQDMGYVKLNITGDTLARPTVTSTKLAYEVGQGILDDITSGKANLKSNLLGRTDIGYTQDGCASLMAYVGGYLIRGFGYDKRPIQITLKDWLVGLNAIYAIGLSYELNADGTYCVRLEQQEYFYSNVQIALFTGVSDYAEPIDTKRIYNELDFGYAKFANDDVSTLDGFNTRHTYLTPIRSLKGKLTQIAPQIADGDTLEITRRVQFSQTSLDSFKFDEDNFIVAVIRDGSGFKPEKVENYTVSGIVGADTVYNLRYAISRNIQRWGAWLNSAWAYKKPSAIIENKYVAKNGDLTSQYTGSSPCEPTQQLTESQDIYVNDLQNARKLFYPDNITFKAAVNWQTLNLLRRCHTGGDYSGRNYGYISVMDPNGDIQSGYLKTLTYNPVTELTTFVLYKKYIPLGTPFDCTPYSAYTFADFEAATGLPAEIEQCRFNNFS